MKPVVLFSFLLFVMLSAKAQLWDELFRQRKTQKKYLLQQIAALRVYAGYLWDGYQIAQEGLTLISDVKNGHFTLDKSYFQSFSSINPALEGPSKADSILAVRKAIVTEKETCIAICLKSHVFSSPDIDLISGVFSKIIADCNSAYDDFVAISTPSQIELSDQERGNRMRGILESVRFMLAYARRYSRSVSLYAVQKYKEQKSIHAQYGWHGIK